MNNQLLYLTTIFLFSAASIWAAPTEGFAVRKTHKVVKIRNSPPTDLAGKTQNSNLPNELLIQIGAHLNNQLDFSNFSSLSRNFNYLAPFAYRAFQAVADLTQLPHEEVERIFSGRDLRSKSLGVIISRDQFFSEAFLKLLPANLVSLKVKAEDSYCYWDTIHIFHEGKGFPDLARFQGLKTFEFKGLSWVNVGPGTDALEDLISKGIGFDLSTLAELPKLTQLSLEGVLIQDISALARIKNLTALTLSQTRATDLSPLFGLTKLSSLTVEGNYRHSQLGFNNDSLSQLPELKKLTQLRLVHLETIQDISPIALLDQITDLEIENFDVEDLSPLEALKKLTRFTLTRTKVIDLSPLAVLPELSSLTLRSTQARLSPLIGLPSLRHLSLFGSIEEIDMPLLSQLNELRSLSLRDTVPSELSPLAKLQNLEALNLYNADMNSASFLLELRNLKKLKIVTYLSRHRHAMQLQIFARQLRAFKRALPGCDLETNL